MCVKHNENWVTPAECHHKQYPTAVFPLELFSGDVKTVTETEECGDSVSLSFCSSIKDKRHFWVAFPLPTCLPTATATHSTAAFLWCICPTSVPKSPGDQVPTACDWLPSLVYSSKKTRRSQHLSLAWIRCILVSLKGLAVAGTTVASWSTDSAILSRGRL